MHQEINSEVINIVRQELKGYGQKTIKAYLGHIKRSQNYMKKDLKLATVEDNRQYILHM